MNNPNLKSIIESILFVAEKPISLNELKSITKESVADLKTVLGEIQNEFQEHGFNVVVKDNYYQLVSSPKNSDIIAKFFNEELRRDLSQAALEILAIISYKQPITRVEIDKIRGVHSGESVRNLMIRGLIEEKGRKDSPGRPILYGTTINFLKHLGLSNVEELPQVEIPVEENADNNPVTNEQSQPV